MQDLGVPRIGRLAAENELGGDRAADLLVQVSVGEEAGAGAARLRRDVRRPQPFRLGARLQLGDQCVVGLERLLVRVDVLLHEGAVPRAQIGKLCRWR